MGRETIDKLNLVLAISSVIASVLLVILIFWLEVI